MDKIFEIKSAANCFDGFEKRASQITKLDKIPVNDECYLSFIKGFKGIELCPDIQIFSYEEALNKNRHMEKESSEIANVVWIIGRSGQGDEWFLDREKLNLLYYDHNNGSRKSSSEFANFGITFLKFIQAGSVIKELEQHLDNGVSSDVLEIPYKNALDSIDERFYALYPYKYFVNSY